MNVVDKLVIALGLDTSGVDKGARQIKSQLSSIGGVITGIFAPLLAGFSFAKIFDSINSELKQLNTLSKVTHTNIEDLTAWSRAVESSGGNMDGFTQTLNTLNDSLTRISVTGSGRMKPFFEKMGLDATELAKKPVLESMQSISKAIEGMDKTESANILRTMGFDSGSIKLLQSGEKGMKELIARQRELGVYTAKDAKAVAALNRGIRDITSAIKTLFIPIVMQIMNTASKVIKYLTNGVMFLRKNMDVLRGAVLLLAAVFSKQLLKAIIDLGRALLANPFGLFIIGLSAILLLLEDLWVYAKGGKTAFGDIWKNLGTPEEVMQGFKRVGTAITNLMKFVGKLFSGQGLGKTTKFLLILVGGIAALVAAIGWIPVAIATAIGLLVVYWDKIEATFSSIVDWFADLGERIKESAISIWDSVSEAFDNAISYITSLWDGLVSAFNSGCNAIAGFLSDAANTARSAWAGFIAWLEEKWNWIQSLLPSLSSIASKLPSIGNAMSVAAKSGGTTNNSAVTDNRQIVNNFNNKESVAEGEKKMGLVGYADTGVK